MSLYRLLVTATISVDEDVKSKKVKLSGYTPWRQMGGEEV
jgi:hypothetical protein